MRLRIILIGGLALFNTACATFVSEPDPTIEAQNQSILENKAETVKLQNVIAELRSENIRLKRSVQQLKLERDQKAKSALAKANAEAAKSQKDDLALITIPAPPKNPDNIIVAEGDAKPLTSVAVPVENTPRLIEPSFASVESVFENEAADNNFQTTSVLFGVHLTSYRNQAEVIAGWRILQRENPDHLGLLEPRVESVSFEGRGEFLRLIAGGFSSREKAEDLCVKLKKRNVYCAVSNFNGDRIETGS